MSSLRLVPTAVVLLICLAPGTGSELQAQVRERIVYFATSTPTGKATTRPYSTCKLVQIRARTLWACPTTAPRKDASSGSDNGNRGSGGRGSGSSGGGDSGGGMGGSDGGGGMGGSDGDGGMN